jgi:hypothetical protein
MTANEVMLPWKKLEVIINELDKACHHFQHETIRELLINAPLAYKPNDPIADMLFLAKQADPKLDYNDMGNDPKIVQFDQPQNKPA